MWHSGTNSVHSRKTLNVCDDTNVWKRSETDEKQL